MLIATDALLSVQIFFDCHKVEMEWAEVGVFGSALCHAATLPYHSGKTLSTPLSAVILVGQVVALVSLCYMVRHATQWEEQMTAAIVVAFVLPHFVLSRSAIQATASFLRLPKRRWLYAGVGIFVTVLLYALLQVLQGVAKYIFDPEDIPAVVSDAPTTQHNAHSPNEKPAHKRVRFEDDLTAGYKPDQATVSCD